MVVSDAQPHHVLSSPLVQVKAGNNWPSFSWCEPAAPPVNGYTYTLWGKATPQNQAEPNNQLGAELCAVANYSQSHMGGQMQAWAWSDTRCNMTAPFICKMSRGWPALMPQAALAW